MKKTIGIVMLLLASVVFIAACTSSKRGSTGCPSTGGMIL